MRAGSARTEPAPPIACPPLSGAALRKAQIITITLAALLLIALVVKTGGCAIDDGDPDRHEWRARDMGMSPLVA